MVRILRLRGALCGRQLEFNLHYTKTGDLTDMSQKLDESHRIR